ncbi:C40 family peptidase [Paenibacillus sp. GCM10023252]|uniref:C40 family peptidase n=1 Tax=Paenibacillus sp. GCM10023252 TaxID=3252649 RepID=UPI00361D0876
MQLKRIFKHIALTTAVCTTLITGIAFNHSNEAEAATAAANKVITTGKTYLGVPYQFGAPAGVTYAFDCSSFVQYTFLKNGIWLPRTSAGQASMGKPVAKGYLSVGDLVFFKTNGKSISHVAVYAGNNNIIHSASSKGVSITSLNNSYWKSKYVTARRVIK